MRGLHSIPRESLKEFSLNLHVGNVLIPCVPLATEPGISLIILPLMGILRIGTGGGHLWVR